MRVNPVVVCALLCSVLYVSPAEGYSAQHQFLLLYCAGTICLFSEFLTRTSTSSSLQKIEGNQVNRRVCKCRSAQCRCSSLQPGRRCCCSSRSSAYLPHQGRVEVAKQQQQGLCCRGRQGPPPGFPSPRPHWSRPVLPGWVSADTAGEGTSAILRSAKSPLSRSAGPNRGEFKLQLMRAKHPLGTRYGHT